MPMDYGMMQAKGNKNMAKKAAKKPAKKKAAKKMPMKKRRTM
jgi:hypothetical protein